MEVAEHMEKVREIFTGEMRKTHIEGFLLGVVVGFGLAASSPWR